MTWSLATEDELSETIGLRLLEEHGVTPTQCLRRGGYGYLRSKMSNWIALAKLHPVVLLTDLDQMACPVQLRVDWFKNKQLPTSLCFRIAVREVEAWLLADPAAINTLFGKSVKLPLAPEHLPDPKRTLLQLVDSKGSRDLKEDMIRVESGVLKQGVGYNARLSGIVRTAWDPVRAAERAPSLARARVRLDELARAVRIKDVHA